MTINWLLACDPETVVIKGPNGSGSGGGSLVFAIAMEAFGRDPHEYVKNKRGEAPTHAPLHRRDRKILAVKEFFENRELVKHYQNKISEFVFGADDIVKVPYVEVLQILADTAHANGGRLLTHCVDRDMQALWFSDVYYSTNIFGVNGPFYKSPKIKNWNSLKFLCSRKFFTSPRLNAKFLERYPRTWIDSTLEGLVMTIRDDLSFVQSHRPQDDVDLLIEVLDHVYTSGISKQDFWDLLNMNHDFYDNKPVTVHSVVSPGSTHFCKVGASVHDP